MQKPNQKGHKGTQRENKHRRERGERRGIGAENRAAKRKLRAFRKATLEGNSRTDACPKVLGVPSCPSWLKAKKPCALTQGFLLAKEKLRFRSPVERGSASAAPPPAPRFRAVTGISTPACPA